MAFLPGFADPPWQFSQAIRARCLRTQMGERNDLSREMPKKTAELHRLMTGFLEEVGAETRRTEK